jgi:hypothetical protein
MKANELGKYQHPYHRGEFEYGETGTLDLSSLGELGPLTYVDIPRAEVTRLPEGYDWGTVTILHVRWHPCWAPVLRMPQINNVFLIGATQGALDQLDRAIADAKGSGILQLHKPRFPATSPWFPPGFACKRVHIAATAEVDFSGAGEFTGIGHLALENVGTVRGLAQLSRQGTLDLVSLEDIHMLDPEQFWEIKANRIIVGGMDRRKARWFYDAWPDRPQDWATRVRLTGALADDLHPEMSWANPFEGYYEGPDEKEDVLPREEITDARFWQVIERAQGASNGSIDSFLDSLSDELFKVSIPDIVAFDQMFAVKTRALYTWDLRGVAHLMLGGCSDDEFTGICSWVVAQGQEYYRACLKDATTLADGRFATIVDRELVESIRSIPDHVYGEMASSPSIIEDYPDQLSDSMIDQTPAGVPWNARDLEVLHHRFPTIRPLKR